MPNTLSPSLLTWLRAFDAAARHASITLAAAELHVSQGAISQQVKNLEEWLGVPLFDRVQRKLLLTQDGQRLKPAVRESLETLENALARLRVDPRQGALKLSCSPSFAARWLTPRLSDLLREYPQLSLRIYGEFHTLDRLRMEQDGVQAAIRFDPGDYADLRAVAFLDEWLIPVATPAFLAAHPHCRVPEELPTLMMLHDASPWQNAEECEEWNVWLRAMGLPVPPQHAGQRFNMSQLAVGAAVGGQGVAMGRLSLVLEDLAAGLLVPVARHAVASRASYHFVTANAPEGLVAVLRDWLLREGARFRKERDRWCRKAGIALERPGADRR